MILDATRGERIQALCGDGRRVVTEKRIVLEIALIAEKLAERGATVVMTRTTDEEFSFFRTVAKAAEVALIRYGEAAELGGYHRDAIDNLRLLMSDIIRINQQSFLGREGAFSVRSGRRPSSVYSTILNRSTAIRFLSVSRLEMTQTIRRVTVRKVTSCPLLLWRR